MPHSSGLLGAEIEEKRGRDEEDSGDVFFGEGGLADQEQIPGKRQHSKQGPQPTQMKAKDLVRNEEEEGEQQHGEDMRGDELSEGRPVEPFQNEEQGSQQDRVENRANDRVLIRIPVNDRSSVEQALVGVEVVNAQPEGDDQQIADQQKNRGDDRELDV